MASQLKVKKQPVIIQGRFRIIDDLVTKSNPKCFKVLDTQDMAKYKLLKEFDFGKKDVNTEVKRRYNIESRLLAELNETKAKDFIQQFHESFFMSNPMAGSKGFIVKEYLTESLSDIVDLNSDRQLCLENTFKIALQIVKGLKRLHRSGIILQDLSDKSIFFTGSLEVNNCLKICDIENSKRVEHFEAEISEEDFIPFKYGSFAQNVALGIDEIDNFESCFYIILRMLSFYDLEDNNPDQWIDNKLEMYMNPESLIPYPFLLKLWGTVRDWDQSETYDPSLFFWAIKNLDIKYREPLDGRVDAMMIFLE